MHIEPDIRVVEGGSAGGLTAIAAREHTPDVTVLILEKGGGQQRNHFVFS